MTEIKSYNITFNTLLCDEFDVRESEFLTRYQGRSLIRGCLQFNDLILADDPWDYNLKKSR